ncbi:single strand DNA binding protein [Vibrio phage vB_VpS_PG07]|uniref:D11 protein n=1 Tax=Vibrio phage vB_VpS_PG07 TaxID=2301664 RepID=A0A385E4M3_9CAUD|nr:single strand DNA binding protein [Vibrio phage vB_VpS_PG07]AXQ66741.1 D11 protein [Vibrio phage vB_VpS_PG07]
MSLNWGEARGEAQKSEVTHMKLTNGNTQFRIVSGVLARMDYWVHNSEGKPRPFECLRYDRKLEKFVGGADPIQEVGLQEKDPDNPGQMRPLRCKRAYKCMVINRKTGKLEAMDLKKSIFDGIMETMEELGIQDPTTVDFVVKRTGEKWNEVKYSINQLATSRLMGDEEVAAMHEADKEIIATMKPIDELFPRMTPEEQRKELQSWLSGGSASGKNEKDSGDDSAADEAISELDD